MQWNLSFVTPLFIGLLHSGDIKKNIQACIRFPLLKGHIYSGERDTFFGSRNLVLTAIQQTLKHSKRDLKKVVNLKSTYANHKVDYLTLKCRKNKLMMIFLNIVFDFYLSTNLSPTPIQGAPLFKRHLLRSRGCPLNKGPTVANRG